MYRKWLGWKKVAVCLVGAAMVMQGASMTMAADEYPTEQNEPDYANEDQTAEDTAEGSTDSDEDSDSSYSSSSYPDEVMKVLRTLKDGEIGPDVIETDTSFYVVKLDKVNDEEATETKKQSFISTSYNMLFRVSTEYSLDDADFKVEN